MEDQDRETKVDEEVEGHSHTGAPRFSAPHKDRNDEPKDDDVEGHMHFNAPRKDAPRKD
jgi:hypothetical protein